MNSKLLWLRYFVFMRQWLTKPRMQGSFVPSSRTLSKLVAKQVDLNKPGVIVELGAGTGCFTRALLEHGIPKDKLLVFEVNPRMTKIIHKRFADIQVFEQCASDLHTILKERDITEINTIVSGLPLLSINKETRDEILHSILSLVDESTHFIQFTYSKKCPISKEWLKQYDLSTKVEGVVKRNFPRATLWRFYKKA